MAAIVDGRDHGIVWSRTVGMINMDGRGGQDGRDGRDGLRWCVGWSVGAGTAGAAEKVGQGCGGVAEADGGPNSPCRPNFT